MMPELRLTVAARLPWSPGQGDSGACFGKGLPKAFPAWPEAPRRSISSLAESWCLKSECEAALIKI